jgi:hypothetical protein
LERLARCGVCGVPNCAHLHGILGFIIALIHLSAFVDNPRLLGSTWREIRDVSVAWGGSSVPTLAVFLALYQRRYAIGGLFPALLPKVVVVPVMGASLFLSFSRTGLVVAAALWMGLANWRPRVQVLGLVVALAVVAFADFGNGLQAQPGMGEGTFVENVLRSMQEATIEGYRDEEAIAWNWRGFEAYIGLESFKSAGPIEKVVGQGFGALVDLGFYMQLGRGGETEFRLVPVLHNGYIYILVKCGLIGLVMYAVLYALLIAHARRGTTAGAPSQLPGGLLLGATLALALSMAVVGGMAEVGGTNLTLLLGFWSRRISQHRSAVPGAMVV